MGPLSGVRVVEFAALGPAPFGGMLLADLGADVISIERPGAEAYPENRHEVLRRGRRSISIDLKSEAGREVAERLIDSADVLIEGFRPGVMERLGLGPIEVHARNPRLIYARMTGWGQDGPYAGLAGHDINFIALNGMLHSIGSSTGAPVPPVNYPGDYGGGGMLLVVGILAALIESTRSGTGQVVDASVVDGSALLMANHWGRRAAGTWVEDRGSNLLDGGAHHYGVYECADGIHVAVGALEPQFYVLILDALGLSDESVPAVEERLDRTRWPSARQEFADAIRQKTSTEWMEVFGGTDACVSVVRSMTEALTDDHVVARGVFIEVDGVTQPAPAPRFGRSTVSPPRAPAARGAHSRAILDELGYSEHEALDLIDSGAIRATEESEPKENDI